ncbi:MULTISPECIES: hypothetical protein [Pseudomonas]|uniref:Uncharacterized protein n=1 Tax=Pseudomonas lutea TaxID=243924 RepID=A0A9X8MHW5_9PSED|nr:MULTISPECIES: hypothetical protein [Pseudomonas]SER51327.1 hypothetical protein SAMN05216409_13211 [Pseudomonas lutea]
MKLAAIFTAIVLSFGMASGGIAKLFPREAVPYIWIAVFIPSVFLAITLTMRLDEKRLRSPSDVIQAFKDGSDLFLNWVGSSLLVLLAIGLLSLLFGGYQ